MTTLGSPLKGPLIVFRTIASKVLIPEHGMAPNTKQYPVIVPKIQGHRWEMFVRQREEGVVPVVREFYANIVEGRSTS